MILEILFGIFFDGFISLSSNFVPRKKLTEKKRNKLKVVFGIIAGVICVGFVLGLFLIAEGYVYAGAPLVILFAVYAVASITLFIIKEVKDGRK